MCGECCESEEKKEEKMCDCGSGKKASDCCEKEEKVCDCGSGKKASECCKKEE